MGHELEKINTNLLVSFVFDLDFGEISNDTCNDANKCSLSVGLNIYMVTLMKFYYVMLAKVLSNMSIQCIKYIHYSIKLKYICYSIY